MVVAGVDDSLGIVRVDWLFFKRLRCAICETLILEIVQNVSDLVCGVFLAVVAADSAPPVDEGQGLVGNLLECGLGFIGMAGAATQDEALDLVVDRLMYGQYDQHRVPSQDSV